MRKIWGKRIEKLSYIFLSFDFVNKPPSSLTSPLSYKPPLECSKLNKAPGLRTIASFTEIEEEIEKQRLKSFDQNLMAVAVVERCPLFSEVRLN